MSTATPVHDAPAVDAGRAPVHRTGRLAGSSTISDQVLEVGYSTVLVPLDGSDRSREVMPTARALAGAFDADLHTIMVVGDLDGLERPDPARVIGERVRELAPSLLCLSTRARGTVGRALFGSVATEVMQRSGPTVVVGPVAERPWWSPPSRSWPAPLSSSRIVVYVDGSEATESTLPLAVAWARTLGKELTVLAVIEDAPAPIRPRSGNPRFAPHDSAEAYVEHVAARWSEQLPGIRGVVRRDPIGPASGVGAHLREDPAALLVVSDRVRAGLRAVRRTASAMSIVRTSTAPCLVVPAASP